MTLSGPANSFVKRVSRGFRVATAGYRVLPDFLIIGAMKAGTSSLFHYLSQHAAIVPASEKEVHFFDSPDRFARGVKWYRSHFPLAAQMGPDSRCFEKSPVYLYDPFVPERIADVLPEVKLIAVLRNPTDRAISHYFHEKRSGRETLPIAEALAEEESRLAASIQTGDYTSTPYLHFSYKRRGLYEEQLKRFLEVFSADQLHVIESGELFNKPDACLKGALEFLGVAREFTLKDTTARNVGDNKTDIDQEIYDYLDDYFAPYNEALFRLIGRTFAW